MFIVASLYSTRLRHWLITYVNVIDNKMVLRFDFISWNSRYYDRISYRYIKCRSNSVFLSIGTRYNIPLMVFMLLFYPPLIIIYWSLKKILAHTRNYSCIMDTFTNIQLSYTNSQTLNVDKKILAKPLRHPWRFSYYLVV